MKFSPLWFVCVLAWASACLPSTVSAQAGFRGQVSRRVPSSARPVESANFRVYADDPRLAARVSSEAERYRKELAIAWLGRELPNWSQPCPIEVVIEPNAGGETSFAFEMTGNAPGTPVDWEMKIFGPPDRVLDAVLPHEITHTIFATHFGRPLPRWADEGACTTVEHASEQGKNHQMLMDFLSPPSRGIPFNAMFLMREYPADILVLYAQGYSLAKFLIYQKGRQHFVDFVSKGLANENSQPVLNAWGDAINEFYGYTDLGDLQIAWMGWVKSGSRKEAIANFRRPSATDDFRMADRSAQPRNQVVAMPESSPAASGGPAASNDSGMATYVIDANSSAVKSRTDTGGASSVDNWYATQMAQRHNRPVIQGRAMLKSQPPSSGAMWEASSANSATIYR